MSELIRLQIVEAVMKNEPNAHPQSVVDKAEVIAKWVLTKESIHSIIRRMDMSVENPRVYCVLKLPQGDFKIDISVATESEVAEAEKVGLCL